MVIPYFERDSVLFYPFEEEFEGAATDFTIDLSTPEYIDLKLTREDAFVGDQSGKVTFSRDRYFFEAISTDFLPLPQSNANDVYVEITYKNDISFTAGLISLSGQFFERLESNVFFNSQGEWSTIYLHVNDLVRSAPSGSLFKLYIRASSLDPDTNEGVSGYLFLDHIRIVQFS